jgi:hypothetical protein
MSEDLKISIEVDDKKMENIVVETIKKFFSGMKYAYRTISCIEILKSERGILNLGGLSPMGLTDAKIQRAAENRNSIENYVNRMSLEGWEFAGEINYENLPYGGNLIFKKLIEIDMLEKTLNTFPTKNKEGKDIEQTNQTYEKKLEVRKKHLEDRKAKLKEELKKDDEPKRERKTVDLEKTFEKETGKHAIYNARETVAYKEWKKDLLKNPDKMEDLAVKEGKQND